MTQEQIKDLREISRLLDELGMRMDELDIDDFGDDDELWELLSGLQDDDFVSKASIIQYKIGDLTDKDMGL